MSLGHFWQESKEDFFHVCYWTEHVFEAFHAFFSDLSERHRQFLQFQMYLVHKERIGEWVGEFRGVLLRWESTPQGITLLSVNPSGVH